MYLERLKGKERAKKSSIEGGGWANTENREVRKIKEINYFRDIWESRESRKNCKKKEGTIKSGMYKREFDKSV